MSAVVGRRYWTAPDDAGRGTVREVYTVHTARPDDVGAVEIVFTDEKAARTYAADRSRDWRVTSASVTRFRVGELGTRTPLAWYADGVEHPQQWNRPCLYPGDGTR